jgi:hypothetical protein
MGWINLPHNNTQWPSCSKTVRKFRVLKKRREIVQPTKGVLGLTRDVLCYVEFVRL